MGFLGHVPADSGHAGHDSISKETCRTQILDFALVEGGGPPAGCFKPGQPLSFTSPGIHPVAAQQCVQFGPVTAAVHTGYGVEAGAIGGDAELQGVLCM